MLFPMSRTERKTQARTTLEANNALVYVLSPIQFLCDDAANINPLILTELRFFSAQINTQFEIQSARSTELPNSLNKMEDSIKDLNMKYLALRVDEVVKSTQTLLDERETLQFNSEHTAK